jgi:phage gpG-like protein
MKTLDKVKLNIDTIPWYQIGLVARSSIHRNFDVGGRPKWKKRKVNKPWPILKKSGNLKRSNRVAPIRHGVQIRNHLIYRNVHQHGYIPRNIPARKYAMLQPGDKVEIKKKIIDHLSRV